MLTVHGYSDLATDKRTADVLKAIEGLYQLPAQDPRARQLAGLLDQLIREPNTNGSEIACPVDVLLLLSRGLELNCLQDNNIDIDSMLSIGFMLADQLHPPGIGTAYLILHARHSLAYKDPKVSFTLAHQAIELARAERSSLHEACALLLAARGQMSLGQHRAAMVYLEGAMAKAIEADEPQVVFEVCLQQGSLALSMGDNELAQRRADDALARCKDLADKTCSTRIQALLLLCRRNTRVEVADLEILMKAREDLAQSDPVTYLSQLDHVAESFLQQGDYDNAEQLTDEVLKSAPVIRQYYPLTRSLHRKGRLALAREQYYLALGCVSMALKLADRHQITEISIRSRIVTGQASILMAKALLSAKSQYGHCGINRLIEKGLGSLIEASGWASEHSLRALQLTGEFRLLECLMQLAATEKNFDESALERLGARIARSHPEWPVDIPESKGKIMVWCSQVLQTIWDRYEPEIQDQASSLRDELLARIEEAKEVA